MFSPRHQSKSRSKSRKDIIVGKKNFNSLSGEEVCLDACRQGSCDPLMNTIFDPAHPLIRQYKINVNPMKCSKHPQVS